VARNSLSRSLQNVRTLSTRSSHAALRPHELYLRLSSLEIERTRRATERRAALDRLGLIESRLSDIESEQDEIWQALAEGNSETLQPQKVSSVASGVRFEY